MACVTNKANVPKKPKYRRPSGVHPAILHQSCQDCYTSSTERDNNWWSQLCREPHLMVWARFKNTRYWPAKAIATQQNKTVVFYFGKRTFALVDSASCLMYSQYNPNRCDQKDLAWMYGYVEADDYICRLINAYGCFRYAGPNSRFDAASIPEHRREVFPDAFSRRFRAIAAVVNGPIANGRRMLAPNRERSASPERRSVDDGAARSADTDEEVDVVTVDPPAAAAFQLSSRDELMAKEHHQRALAQLRTDHEEELARAKKLVWCSVCEEPAVMICCWSYFYCSEECFLRDSHRQVCRKPYMADHVAVARRPTPSILAPMLANYNVRQRAGPVAGPTVASTASRPRPMPYHTWQVARHALPAVGANRAVESRPPYQVGSVSAIHSSSPMNDGQVDANAIHLSSEPLANLELLAYAASQFAKYSGQPPRS